MLKPAVCKWPNSGCQPRPISRQTGVSVKWFRRPTDLLEGFGGCPGSPDIMLSARCTETHSQLGFDTLQAEAASKRLIPTFGPPKPVSLSPKWDSLARL